MHSWIVLRSQNGASKVADAPFVNVTRYMFCRSKQNSSRYTKIGEVIDRN